MNLREKYRISVEKFDMDKTVDAYIMCGSTRGISLLYNYS